jgi:hypothetical protein
VQPCETDRNNYFTGIVSGSLAGVDVIRSSISCAAPSCMFGNKWL